MWCCSCWTRAELSFSPKELRMVVLSVLLNTDWLWCLLSRWITAHWRCITLLSLSPLKKQILVQSTRYQRLTRSLLFYDFLWILMNKMTPFKWWLYTRKRRFTSLPAVRRSGCDWARLCRQASRWNRLSLMFDVLTRHKGAQLFPSVLASKISQG